MGKSPAMFLWSVRYARPQNVQADRAPRVAGKYESLLKQGSTGDALMPGILGLFERRALMSQAFRA